MSIRQLRWRCAPAHNDAIEYFLLHAATVIQAFEVSSKDLTSTMRLCTLVIAVLLTANYVRSTALAVGESKIFGRNHR